jgi:hypothetical protein
MSQVIGKRAARRLLTTFLPAMAVIALATAAAAYACTNLATLDLSQGAGAPGSSLTAVGSSFTPKAPVVLHWNSLTGPVLAKIPASAAGAISATAKIPSTATPGSYVVVATQTVQGAPAFGTPARATFQVVGPGGATASSSQAGAPATNPLASVSTSSSSGVSGGLLVATILLAVIGVSLFGFGAAGYARQRRKSEVPATAPEKKQQ